MNWSIPTDPTGARIKTTASQTRRDGMTHKMFMEVDRQNKILLDKLGEVMRGKYLSSTKVDFNSSKFTVFMIYLGPFKIASLGETRIKTEHQRIQSENQHFLGRLQGPCTASQYKTIKYEEDYKERSQIIKNVVRYPYILN